MSFDDEFDTEAMLKKYPNGIEVELGVGEEANPSVPVHAFLDGELQVVGQAVEVDRTDEGVLVRIAFTEPMRHKLKKEFQGSMMGITVTTDPHRRKH